jgi:hypothetical protein
MRSSTAHFIRQSATLCRATLRQAVHTGAAFWMFTGTIAAAALPMALRGDGSTGSTLRLSLTYPPILLFMILLTGTIWMAAATMAQELESGEMASVIIKPIHPAVLWIGKWLGILLLNAGLMTASASIFIPIVSTIAKRDLPPGETSYADGHRVFHPDDSADRQEALDRMDAQSLAASPVEERSFDWLLNIIKTENSRVIPGQTCTWPIPLDNTRPPPPSSHSTWDLQFTFRCDPLTRTPVDGTWTVSTPQGLPVTVNTGTLLDGLHQVQLPQDAALHPGVATVTFSNRQDSSTVYFDPRSAVTLRRWECPFEENLIRAYAVLFCFLATTAAIALTMGVVFSFPVAVFTVLSLFFAIAVSLAFAQIPPPMHRHGDVPGSGVIMPIGEQLLSHIHRATASTLQRLPLAALSHAQVISNHQILQAITRLLAAVPAMLCALSALLLGRKEFP